MASTQTSTALQQGNLFAPKPTTSASAPPHKPVEKRTRAYKDFLTPALHRRFTSAAFLLLGTCYVTSILFCRSSLSWFWSLFLFHPFCAFLLFISCLVVFIIRVANMHVGKAASSSKAQSIWQTATSREMAHTLMCYMASAFFFGEVFLWTRGSGSTLEWVDRGRSFADGLEERPILNENPLLLRALWMLLAVLQTGWHLSRDDDRLPIPEKEMDEKRISIKSYLPETVKELADMAPALLRRIVWLMLPALVLILPIYWLLLRRTMWSIHAALSGVFFSRLPTDSNPGGIHHVPWFIAQAVTSSFLLTTLWELSSAAFTVYVCQPPMRNDQPLTAEIKNEQGVIISRSNDPNGSLLNGLKSRKEVPKAFAFWELSLICEHFEVRRKTIYTEVDRKDGSTWTQLSSVCLAELEAIQNRIGDALAPTGTIPPAQEETKEPPARLGLSKIADREVVSNGNVLQYSKRNDMSHRIGDVAKYFGQSPQSAEKMERQAFKAIEQSAERIIPKRTQERFNPTTLTKETNETVIRLLRSPVGEPFMHTFARRAETVVFGKPHSARTNIARASQALCILCMHSLQEDDYGQVARSVPLILRTYTATITAIMSFMVKFAPHWTDVDFVERDRRDREVEEILTMLKAGLEGVILAFGEYAEAIGVTRKEMREAREAVGRGLEMRKI